MKFLPQRLDTLPQGRVERSKSSVGGRTDVVPPAAENPWSRSLWLEGVVEDLTPREPLSGDHTCDVAIVGAGFGGLWTAYYLKAADPSLRVTVIEAEIAGFGAAGRNGGFISPGIAGSAARYARVSGWDSVLRAERETQHGVDEIGRVISPEGIDCGYNKGGALTVATTDPQAQRVRAKVEAKHRFGLGPDDIRLLTAEECADLVRGAEGVLAGSFTPHCARVDPARLARGLAAACERLGVKIFEQSPAQHLGPKVVQCRDGRVTADVVVRATESYTIQRAKPATQLPAPLLPDDRHRTPPAGDLGRARVARRSRDRRHQAPLLLRPADDRRQDRTGRPRSAVPTDQSPLTPERAGRRSVPAAVRHPARSVPRRVTGSHHPPLGRFPGGPPRLVHEDDVRPQDGARIRGCVRRSRRHRRQHLRPHHARPDPERQHRPDIAPVGGTPHPQLGTRAHPVHRRQAHHQDPRRLRLPTRNAPASRPSGHGWSSRSCHRANRSQPTHAERGPAALEVGPKV